MGACLCRNIPQEPLSISLPLPVPAPAIPRFVAPGADDSDNILRKPFEDVSSRFAIGDELGRGRFGVTYVCHEQDTGHPYACKSIAKCHLGNESDRDNVRREVSVMQRLSGHPNIVEFKGAYEDANAVHLVMELYVGGYLFDRIIAKGSYSERAAAGIFRDIINAVDVSHFMGVILRDLKPENFLLTSNDEGAMLKAVDFEFSAFFEEGNECTDVVGISYYTAPEVIRRSTGRCPFLWSAGYAQAADVWSAGVILYILLSGAPPFSAPNEKGISDAVLKGDIDFQSNPWPTISDSAKDLIRKMLTQDPTKRITALEALGLCVDPGGGTGTASEAPLDSAVLPRLKQLRAIYNLKKTALEAIAEHSSEEWIEELKQSFINKDTTKSGTIPYKELIHALSPLGIKLADAEMRQLVDAAEIDYMEFIHATLHRHRRAGCSRSEAECSRSAEAGASQSTFSLS